MFVKQLQDLLIAEMAEQKRWTPAIPLWHPRNEGDDPPKDPPKPDPANPGGPPPSSTPPPDPKAADAASAEVAKAYEKLRASEATVKDLKPKADKADSLQAENETLKAENASLKNTAREAAARTVITSEARKLNFHNPDRALEAIRVYTDVDPLTLDSAEKVDKALRDLATAEQHLVGAVPPSGGPVHPASQQQGGNAAVNREIRAMAGRSS